MAETGNAAFIAIAAIVGGLMFATAFLFMILARDQIIFMAPSLWAYVVLGAALGFFSYKKKEK